MDPDATLRELLCGLAAANVPWYVIFAAADLEEWLADGGFLPDLGALTELETRILLQTFCDLLRSHHA